MTAAFSWSFTTVTGTSSGSFTQTSTADFSGGTATGTTVTNLSGGEIQLGPVFFDDFLGTTLGAGWTLNSWSSAGGGPASSSVANGLLSLSGAGLTSSQVVNGIAIEGRVNFAAAPLQHFGVATSLAVTEGNSWAIFSTMGTTNRLFARVNVSGRTTDVNLGNLPSGFHTYRIQPVSGGFQFLIDGVLSTTISANIPSNASLRVAISSFNGSPRPAIQVDWIRAAAYNATGTFTSSVLDAGRSATWGAANWTADLPSGTSMTIETSSSVDGVTWSSWSSATNGGTIGSPAGRYIRYRVTLATTASTVTPTLSSISLAWS